MEVPIKGWTCDGQNYVRDDYQCKVNALHNPEQKRPFALLRLVNGRWTRHIMGFKTATAAMKRGDSL